MLCTLCANNEEKTTRFIPLYVFGSEGLNVCHECEMQLVGFARLLRFNNMRLTFVKLDNSVIKEVKTSGIPNINEYVDTKNYPTIDQYLDEISSFEQKE